MSTFLPDYAHISDDQLKPWNGIVSTDVAGIFPESTKATILQIKGEPRSNLFQNPMVTSISSMTSNISTINTTLTQIASNTWPDPNGVGIYMPEVPETIDPITGLPIAGTPAMNVHPTISSNAASAYLATSSLPNLTGSLTAFSAHTNRLAGVLEGVGIATPGLEQIVSISAQMNLMSNMIDGGKGCLGVIGGATGLFSEETFGEMTGGLADIVEQIDNGIMTISNIVDTVLIYKQMIEGIVAGDLNFFGQMVQGLKDAAFAMVLGGAMSDPCAKFVIERVGMPSLISNLQKPGIPGITGLNPFG